MATDCYKFDKKTSTKTEQEQSENSVNEDDKISNQLFAFTTSNTEIISNNIKLSIKNEWINIEKVDCLPETPPPNYK